MHFCKRGVKHLSRGAQRQEHQDLWAGWQLDDRFLLVLGPFAQGSQTTSINWFPVKGNGVGHKLAFDHNIILETAISRLRGKAEYTSLPAYLLPETFTLSELQHVFSVVLGRPVDKSDFRTRVLSAGLVEEADGIKTGPSRPAQLYRLKTPKHPTFFPRTFSPRKE